MTQIEIEVIQEVKGGQVFADLIARSVDMTPLFAEIAQLLERIRDRSFKNESTPQGPPWAELAIKTQIQRKHRGFGPKEPILIQTGELYRSIQASSGPDWAEIGTDVYYAKYHQAGTDKMPARQIVGLGAGDEQSIINMANAYFAFSTP
jgi:phage virion morphogenesis protein